MRAANWLDGNHARHARIGEVEAHFLDALALGGLHGDETFELDGGSVEALDVFANAVVRKFHSSVGQAFLPVHCSLRLLAKDRQECLSYIIKIAAKISGLRSATAGYHRCRIAS